MKRPLFVWDPEAPHDRSRRVVGYLLPVFVLVALNYYADWHLFRGYDHVVYGAALGCGFLAYSIFSVPWPADRPKRPLSDWLVTALLLAAGLGLLLT